MKLRRNSRPRNSYNLAMDEQGSSAAYWNERNSLTSMSPFRVIDRMGENDFANSISDIRLSVDAVQSLDYRRERIKTYFHGLDEWALRAPFLEQFPASVGTQSQGEFMVDEESCVVELVALEDDIYRVWDGLSRGGYQDESHRIASRKLIPTLLFLLKGVIVRHQGEVIYHGDHKLLRSCDLYGRLIRQTSGQEMFVLRILRQLPAPYATEEQKQEKLTIAQMINQLNRDVGLQSTPSIRFQHELERIWN
jgi:hypothetical protein